MTRSLLPLLLCSGAVAATVDFQRQVRPVLAKKCFACHGPDEQARKANLRLDSFEGATGKSGGYAGIVPGSSAKSRIVARIASDQAPMPPTGERLSTQEIQMLKEWIDEGAEYRQHWAFAKPTAPAQPPVRDAAWPKTGLDYFVLARLEKEGLKPSPEADRYTLARRVALDLTGLPPEREWLEEFLRDKSSQAYERLVDRALASPHYGERWAKVWLDLARYADTQGYEKDNRRTIWPYRDWVVKAYNDNVPFDRFTILQLAGDLIPSPAESDLIATGFHRNTMTNTEGGTDDEEFRDAAVKDRVAVTGQVWMGLTFGCAQCHSHKYDPLSHKEFYQLYDFYNHTEDNDQPDDRPTLKLANASTLVLRDLAPDKRRKTRIHERGNFLNPGAEVSAGVPESFHALQPEAPRNRLGLAQWLVDKNNPLTARVQVNRYWARLFGRGLVESEEDFGTQGMPPTQPEVLDWLAAEYMRLGWDTKALLKTIAMSATYRQTSDVTPALREKDPSNKLLARGARFRLDAEIVRDQALAVSGLLSRKQGGPPVMPWQPEGIWQVVYNGEKWITSPGEDRYRRGLYTFMRRTSPYPSMITYDAPTGEVCTVRRIRTNTPLQALAALNDPVSMEAAQKLALRSIELAGVSARAIAERMVLLALGRPAAKQETRRLLALHRESAKELAEKAESSGKLLQYDRTLYTEDRRIVLVADARTSGPEWSYSTEAPTEADWAKPGFDASSWKKGKALFGYLEKPNKDTPIVTPWETDQLWARVEFDLPADRMDDFTLHMRASVVFDVMVNGVTAVATNIDRNAYYDYPLHKDALAALKPGRNVLAVHLTRQRSKKEGQLFDLGLSSVRTLDFADAGKQDANRAAWVVVANAVLNLDEMLTRR